MWVYDKKQWKRGTSNCLTGWYLRRALFLTGKKTRRREFLSTNARIFSLLFSHFLLFSTGTRMIIVPHLTWLNFDFPPVKWYCFRCESHPLFFNYYCRLAVFNIQFDLQSNVFFLSTFLNPMFYLPASVCVINARNVFSDSRISKKTELKSCVICRFFSFHTNEASALPFKSNFLSACYTMPSWQW